MQVPANMTTPRLKLADGEQVLSTYSTLRKKGLFGNRFGELHVTTQRVAFVKAVMRGLIGAVLDAKGVKPMFEFERGAVTKVEKVHSKKLVSVVITTPTVSEKFMVDEAAADQLIAALGPA